MTQPSRPLPKPDEDTEPFWAACRRHELRMQKCLDCGTVRFRPALVCPECLSDRYEWALLSGKGEVYTFGVVHRALVPGFESRIPYIVALVQLQEGPRMTTNLVDVLPEQVYVGMPVEVAWEDVTEEISLPVFRPAAREG